MASIDDELLLDAEEDQREAQWILTQLSTELKERFTTDDILQLMDYIVDYYYESGVLDLDNDDVEIDLEEVAAAVCRNVQKDSGVKYRPEDVFFIVQADLDYQEQNL
jgi:hypothetical protein